MVTMNPNLNILFYIGIIVPTTITIGFFIGFLVCWFQCNLKQKLLEVRDRRRKEKTKPAELDDMAGEKMEKASQHSADSAIDVNELEAAVVDTGADKTRSPHTSSSVQQFYNNNTNITRNHPRPPTPPTISHVLTEAEIHTSLSRGAYPSHEKLNDEIHSEPRIYECQEDIELAIYNGLASPHQYHNVIHNINTPQQNININTKRSYLYNPCKNSTRQTARRQHPQQAYYHSAPRLLANKRVSYSSSIGMFEDNHTTDYGFAPWQQRPNSVCALRAGSISSSTGFSGALTLSRPKYAPSNLSWKANISDNHPCEILHV